MSHLRRPPLEPGCPLHVTWRVGDGVPSLLGKRCLRAVRQSLVAARGRLGARVVHYSVRSNHVHMIVEARSAETLSRGLQGIAIRMARSLNAALGRSGRLFGDRYEARALETPLEVRTALACVLGNSRESATERGMVSPGWMDESSSAMWFDGWKSEDAGKRALRLARAGPLADSPVEAARTSLLRVGWRRHGLLDPDPRRG